MRVRALLLVLLAGGIAAGGSAMVGTDANATREPQASAAMSGRAEPVDAPAPAVVSRARDGIGRGVDALGDVLPWLALTVALSLAALWVLAGERRTDGRRADHLAVRRPRAPPRPVIAVHS